MKVYNKFSFGLIIVFLLFSTNSTAFQSSQNQRIERQGAGKVPVSLLNSISINLENVSFEEALTTIARQGDFLLSYNRGKIPLNKKVTVKMDHVAAIEALIKILSDTNTGLLITEGGQIAVVPYSSLSQKNDNKPTVGSIEGVVKDKASGETLYGANVYIVGSRKGSAAGKDGRFVISYIEDGLYTIEASYIGYEKQRYDIQVIDGSTVNLEFELTERILKLGEIIVTPGHFSLMERQPLASNALQEEDLRSFPQLGEDIYRAATRLPGIAGNDFSSKFTIRGGEHDEVLVLLDGMELYDPFHLKDLDGFMSVVDVEAIKNIDLITGAFPSEYGNRLSGVFNMKTITPIDNNTRTSMAISFMNARFLSEGKFNNSKGSWLVLARRGYLDMLLKMVEDEESDDELLPVYYDLLGKFQYAINKDHIISLHTLTAVDDNIFDIDEGKTKVDTEYGNKYYWLNWDAQYRSNLHSQTVVYTGKMDQDGNIEASDLEGDINGIVNDKRNFSFYGVKQNWSYNYSDNSLFKWGFETKSVESNDKFYSSILRQTIVAGDYNDPNEIEEFETTSSKNSNDGTFISGYLSNRFRITPQVAIEFGVRYDHASWTSDDKYSPRLNFVYNIGNRSVIRAGWGKFYQSQGIHQLNIQDGDEIFYPAELAEHRVIGLEHSFTNGTNIRVEFYQKKMSNLRPHYINYEGPSLNIFAYVHDDRMRLEPDRGESKGFEIYLNKDIGSRLSWWASYGLSEAYEKIDGKSIPWEYDQRHTVYLDLNFRPNVKWSLNTSWQFHTGWPHTESKDRIVEWYHDNSYAIEWYPGPLLAERLPAYHRMDIRATRFINTSHGRISFFLEVRNLYDRENVREYQYNHMGSNNGIPIVKKTGIEGFLPRLPSFGIAWDF